MPSAAGRDATTRLQILDAAVSLIERSGSASLRIQDVARLADVGPPTIYYYFEDRQRLVAAAQAERLRRFIMDADLARTPSTEAIEAGDFETYADRVVVARQPLWSTAYRDRLWDLIDILSDVRRDEEVRAQVAEVVDEILRPRIKAVEDLQKLGWVTDEIDPTAWVLFYYGAVIGQLLAEVAVDCRPTEDAHQAVLEFVHRSVARGPAEERP